MPPSAFSENAWAQKRQGFTRGLSTAGCRNPRHGVGVAYDGSNATREMRCLSQETTLSVAGRDGGCDGGGAGIGGMQERRTKLSPIGLPGACCLSEEGGVIKQRPGEAGRVGGEEEAVGGLGGKNGSPDALKTIPDALNPCVNRGSFEPGLSCPSVVAFSSPVKGCPWDGGPLGSGDDKENRRV